jgi:hypothetical protein
MTIAARLQQYLDSQGVGYDTVPHQRMSTSAGSAQATHVPGDRLANPVVIDHRWLRPSRRPEHSPRETWRRAGHPGRAPRRGDGGGNRPALRRLQAWDGPAHRHGLRSAGARRQIPFVCEFYSDLDYNDEGRNIITREHDPVTQEDAAVRVRRAITEGKARAVSDKDVAVVAESICVHSDTPGAAAIARAVREVLAEFV